MIYILCVLWFFIKHMRVAFYIAFMSKFDCDDNKNYSMSKKENDNDLSKEERELKEYWLRLNPCKRHTLMQEMIDRTKLATFTTYHCCNVFVCSNILFLFCVLGEFRVLLIVYLCLCVRI